MDHRTTTRAELWVQIMPHKQARWKCLHMTACTLQAGATRHFLPAGSLCCSLQAAVMTYILHPRQGCCETLRLVAADRRSIIHTLAILIQVATAQ